MNYKEEAIRLMEKFSPMPISKTYSAELTKSQKKHCALIHLNELYHFNTNAKTESQFEIKRKIEEYCDKVKREIELL